MSFQKHIEDGRNTKHHESLPPLFSPNKNDYVSEKDQKYTSLDENSDIGTNLAAKMESEGHNM